MFRPTEIHLYRAYIQRESAFTFLTKIGQLKGINLINLEGSDQYVNQIQRCSQLHNKIIEIKHLLGKHNKIIHYCSNYDAHLTYTNISENDLNQIELELLNKTNHLEQQNEMLERITIKYMNLVEKKEIFEKCKDFIFRFSGIQLSYIVGCINTIDETKFNRLIFRSTKQNGIVTFYKIVNMRSAFIIVYSGQALKQKLNKICEAFNATLYDLPSELEMEKILNNLNGDIQNCEQLILNTKTNLEDQLDYFVDIHVEKVLDEDEIYDYGYCSRIAEVEIKLKLIQATYFHLNLFSFNFDSYVQGMMWCTNTALKQIQDLGMQVELVLDNKEKIFEPPTYMKINSFTSSFQQLVCTYGYPRYNEINPALFTIITFPFLFGMMFGDIGHGAVLFLFGLYLIFFGQSILKSSKLQSHGNQENYFQTLFEARYLLTLMGFFAFYCGLIYNDFFSISLEYRTTYFQIGFSGNWSLNEQHLQIMNSFKMKTAIVIGVTHMVFGILLKGWNMLYQKKWIEFIFGFIPELLFMLSTFGYMSFLIIIKWLSYYENPPSIITTLLNMLFTLGGVIGQEMYPYQEQIQNYLIYIILISISLMITKPQIIHEFHSRKKLSDNQLKFIEAYQQFQESQKYGLQLNKKKLEQFRYDKMEMIIECTIQIIEFILGAVSNTASYLRLWALSLAHSQLSEVFFKMCLQSQIEEGSIIGIIIGFMVFSFATFGVLMCMDTLECFLHSLRLHWVEFQDKFYKGDGYQFQQFNYLEILEQQLSYN